MALIYAGSVSDSPSRDRHRGEKALHTRRKTQHNSSHQPPLDGRHKLARGFQRHLTPWDTPCAKKGGCPSNERYTTPQLLSLSRATRTMREAWGVVVRATLLLSARCT